MNIDIAFLQRYFDGGFTNSLPRIPGGRTILVSPFSGGHGINPTDTNRSRFKMVQNVCQQAFEVGTSEALKHFKLKIFGIVISTNMFNLNLICQRFICNFDFSLKKCQSCSPYQIFHLIYNNKASVFVPWKIFDLIYTGTSSVSLTMGYNSIYSVNLFVPFTMPCKVTNPLCNGKASTTPFAKLNHN